MKKYNEENIKKVIEMVGEERANEIQEMRKNTEDFHLAEYKTLQIALSDYKLEKQIKESDVQELFQIPEEYKNMITGVDYVITEVITKLSFILKEDIVSDFNQKIKLGGENKEMTYLINKTVEALNVLQSNEESDKEEFIAMKTKNAEISNKALAKMGISLLKEDSPTEVIEKAKELGVNLSSNDSLEDYGLTLSMLGTLDEPKWVLHKLELTVKFISDILKRENLFDVYHVSAEGLRCIGTQVYLREDNFEEDVVNFVKKHYKSSEKELDSDLIH